MIPSELHEIDMTCVAFSIEATLQATFYVIIGNFVGVVWLVSENGGKSKECCSKRLVCGIGEQLLGQVWHGSTLLMLEQAS